jgi:cytochrome c-type biogenesis protein CcmF
VTITFAAMVGAGDLAVLALFVGCAAGAVVSVLAVRRGDAMLARTAGRLLAAAAVAGVTAVLLLARALVTSDFTLAYVVEQARVDGPWWYRLAGLWGGMAGSLLVWTVMIVAVGVIAARRLAQSEEPVAVVAGARAAIGAVGAAFAAVVALFADPFVRLATPAIDGAGLTPILEHPAMLYHPPLLYAGLTSLAAPFAYTVGAAVAGRLDRAWLDRTRRWAMVPWVLLGVGMVAGAHWAYVEVGWGGYWGWDPVENTALLPWLAVTAFIHAAMVRPGVSRAAPVLVVGAFLVALLGTLLTRSGATQSVHVFAEDPAVGWALLALVVAVGIATACLLTFRSPTRDSAHASPRSRVLWVNVVGMTLALGVVLLGTLYPVLASLRGRDDVAAVDPGFFAGFIGPLALAGLALSGIGPRLGGRLRLGAPAAVGVAGLVLAWVAGWRSPFGLAVAGLGGFAIAASLIDLVRQRRPVHLAHLGFAVLLVGIAGSSTGASVGATVGAGDRLSVAGYDVINEGATVITDPGVDEQRVAAPVTVERNGTVVARLTPEIRIFPDRGDQLAETALWSSWRADVQVALRDADDDGRALLQVHVRPLMLLVWWGGLLMVVGGAWAFSRRPAEEGARRAPPASDRAAGQPSPSAGR